jgi:hypothetical protein
LGYASGSAAAAGGHLEVSHVAYSLDIGHFDFVGQVLPVGSIPQDRFGLGQSQTGEGKENGYSDNPGSCRDFYRLTTSGNLLIEAGIRSEKSIKLKA